jgi:hypothetical protein
VQDLNHKVSIATTCSCDLSGLYGASLISKISEKPAGFCAKPRHISWFAQTYDMSHGFV